MKKITLSLIFVIALNLAVLSQIKDNERENFNGTWVVDMRKSTNVGKGIDNYFLIIDFKDNKFKVAKVFVSDKKAGGYELTLSTDKSGEENTYNGFNGTTKRTSKTYWQKNTLVSDYKILLDNKKLTFGGTERYYLSKDGKNLVFESVQTSPALPFNVENQLKIKMVFQRKEPKS